VKPKLLALATSMAFALSVGASSLVAFAATGDTDLHTQGSDKGVEPEDLEAKLADARARLEEAAHEVAELSSQLGGPLVDKFMTFDDDYRSRAVIGVQLDPESSKDGARIQEVSPGGPAQEAGLRVGDVITQVNGTDIKGDRTARTVVKLMQKIEPEKKVTIRVLRDGKSRDFAVNTRRNQTFLGMNNRFFSEPPVLPPLPGVPGPGMTTYGPVIIHGSLGQMELVTLTPQLGRYFGTDKGVLVVRAPKDFKLEDGDVILAIDGREPSSGSHATRILASYQPGEKISMKIMRQQKAVNVETTLPDRHAFVDPWDGEDPGRKTKTMSSKAPSSTT
jgi:S1-C subfamily serine protease